AQRWTTSLNPLYIDSPEVMVKPCAEGFTIAEEEHIVPEGMTVQDFDATTQRLFLGVVNMLQAYEVKRVEMAAQRSLEVDANPSTAQINHITTHLSRRRFSDAERAVSLELKLGGRKKSQ
ncbi:hypothetical protein LTR66_017740, partial [Elasticomyces elasticus]